MNFYPKSQYRIVVCQFPYFRGRWI